MKKKDKKLEDFWDGLEVRKPDDDRELQRKVVLGADAIVRTICKGILRGIVLAILIFIVLYAIQQNHSPARGLRFENWHFVEDQVYSHPNK